VLERQKQKERKGERDKQKERKGGGEKNRKRDRERESFPSGLLQILRRLHTAASDFYFGRTVKTSSVAALLQLCGSCNRAATELSRIVKTGLFGAPQQLV
jgi:hypothetical protein